MKNEILRMEHISVIKNGDYALSDFRLNIISGECISVYGFEGSGVRELGEVILGRTIYHEGCIYYKENLINQESFSLAEQKSLFIIGVNTVIMPELSVAENLFFGDVRHYLGLPAKRKQQETFARGLLSKFGTDIDVKKKGRDLHFHEILIVSLVRAYAQNARLIVFIDPPDLNSIKHGNEIKRILAMIKESGVSILWIDNHIDGIQELIDGIVVMRNGKNARTFYHEDYSLEEINHIAENRQLPEEIKRLEYEGHNEVILKLENISDDKLKGLSISVKKGMVTGINANEPDILQHIRSIICGEKTDYNGKMYLDDLEYHPNSYEDAVKKGIQYVDIMRYENHAVGGMSVLDNMLLQNYWMQKPLVNIVSGSLKKHMATEMKKRHRDWKLGKWENLEIWKQQILLLERFLYQPGKVCIITEPFIKFDRQTLDAAIGILQELIDRGKTLILLSVSIPDLRLACEEISIISNGEQAATVSSRDFE